MRGDGLLSHQGAVEATGQVTIYPRFPVQEEGETGPSALTIDGRVSREAAMQRHTTQEAAALVSVRQLPQSPW